MASGEFFNDGGGAHTPLLASRSHFDEEHHLLDFSKLSLAPRRSRTRSRAQELLHESQIPLFMKKHCIVWHYRPQSRFMTAALSVFRLHNETVNIWSHAIGALIYASSPTRARYESVHEICLFLVSTSLLQMIHQVSGLLF